MMTTQETHHGQETNNWANNDRQAALARLKANAQPWDMIVVGGGITGAGVALEAARAGARVLVLEQTDFAWGTSSRSSKMVHGGLRYLAQGDFRLTRHSVEERQVLMDQLPGLVDYLPYIMAHYKGRFPGPFVFNLLLTVYDFFAKTRYRRFHPVPYHAYVTPGIKDDGLIGVTQFADAVTDDSRLVLRVLHEAMDRGAEAFNYMRVESALREGDQVRGVRVKDLVSGEAFDLSARVVVNATGAWVDHLRGQMGAAPVIRPLRGSHFVVPYWTLPVSYSVTHRHPRDKRPVFIYPWEGRTVVGTTDLDHKASMDEEACMTGDELSYLMELIDDAFPDHQVTRERIISSFAGVRPVVSGGAKDPSKEKRDHSVWNDNGLISVSGGKLTTFRLIALDVLAEAVGQLPELMPKMQPHRYSQPVGAVFQGITAAQRHRLGGRYGRHLESLVQAIHDYPGMVGGSDILWGELAWSAANEAVQHLDDLLLRRSRVGLLVEGGGLNHLDQLKPLCQNALGWNDARWDEEVSRYRLLWRRHYQPLSGGGESAEKAPVPHHHAA